MKEIEVKGEKKPVSFSWNALEEFHELTGLEVLELLTDVKEITKPKNLRALAYCALKHGNIESGKNTWDKTIQDVGSWFQYGDKATKDLFAILQGTYPQGSDDTSELDEEAKK